VRECQQKDACNAHTLCLAVSQLLAYGRAGESPWLWLIIPAIGVALYAIDRFRKSAQAEERSFASVFLGGARWWQQAIYLAIIGGGSLYHFATGHYQ